MDNEAWDPQHAIAVPDAIDLDAAKERPDRIGDIARSVGTFEAAGIVPSHSFVAEIPSSEVVAQALAGLAPLPDELRAFLSTMPSRFDLAWSDDEVEAHGFVSYELARVSEIHQRCTDQVREWLEGLPRYYRVWADSFAFMEVEDGAGFLAVHEDGSVRYLDDQGDTNINGWRLAGSLEEFWATWSSLGFIAIQPENLRELTDGKGMSVESVGGRRILERLE